MTNDPTLTDLGAEYRANAGVLDASVAEAETLAALGYRTSYHNGYADACRREAADWAALADLVGAAARRHPQTDEADRALAAAARRLATHLEDHHA